MDKDQGQLRVLHQGRLPGERWHRFSSASLCGAVYIAGGIAGRRQPWAEDHTESVARYCDGEWRMVAPMSPGGRPSSLLTSSTILCADKGKLFAIRSRSKTAEEYDPGADRWTPIPFVPQLGGGVVGPWEGVCGPDGRLYLLGGYNTANGYSVSISEAVQVYDPRSGDWAKGPQLQKLRGEPAMAVWGGRIWALGGWREGRVEKTVESLDLAAWAWQLSDKTLKRYSAGGKGSATAFAL